MNKWQEEYPELKERIARLERDLARHQNNAIKFETLWMCAASCIAHNSDKLQVRGMDERRIISIALDQDYGPFWSGKTDGWIPCLSSPD